MIRELKNSILRFAAVKYYIAFAMFCLALTGSCSDKKDYLSEVTISEDTMAKIIKDMTKANYMIATSHDNPTELSKKRTDYKKSICKRYNTTAETYDHDLKIYLGNPKVMQRILEKTRE